MSGAAKVVSGLAKPKMRGMLADKIKRDIFISLGLGFASMFAFKVAVCDRRKAVYAEFYRTYDADKDFEEKRAKGIFTSC